MFSSFQAWTCKTGFAFFHLQSGRSVSRIMEARWQNKNSLASAELVKWLKKFGIWFEKSYCPASVTERRVLNSLREIIAPNTGGGTTWLFISLCVQLPVLLCVSVVENNINNLLHEDYSSSQWWFISDCPPHRFPWTHLLSIHFTFRPYVVTDLLALECPFFTWTTFISLGSPVHCYGLLSYKLSSYQCWTAKFSVSAN